MPKSRFHYADLTDSASIVPTVDPRTNPGRRLTQEEIAALYPGASIALNPNPRTQEERFQCGLRNQRARKSDYRSMYGYRE